MKKINMYQYIFPREIKITEWNYKIRINFVVTTKMITELPYSISWETEMLLIAL